jgi:PAS domain S-box-containing protein
MAVQREVSAGRPRAVDTRSAARAGTPHPVADAVLVVLLVGTAGAVAAAASTVLHATASFFPFLIAVAIAAFRSGAYFGVLATCLSALLAVFFFIAPVGTFVVTGRADQAALALFAIEGLAISGLGEFARRGRLRMERRASESVQFLRGQQAVARLGQLAVVHHDLDPLFEAAALELGDVLEGDITAIMQHIPGSGALRIVAGSGWREGVVGQAVIPDNAGSHSGFALISDGPVVSMDYATEDRFRASPIVLEHGARSGVTTPIVGPGGPWGVLGVHSLTPGRFDSDQVALLDTFANVLGSAISRRAVEMAVRDRDARIELALAASKTGFWEWNVQTGRVHWSDEICRLHGREPGTEMESLDEYLDLIHPEDREWVRERVHGAIETGSYDARFRIVLPDGGIRWTHGSAKVFFDPEHRAVRMIGVARDVTEEVAIEHERERRVETELRQGELNQAFIGVVSHELRTPITSIYGGSKLLRRMGPADSEKRSELTANIEAEAERLYNLTEDLLVLTRVERGTLDIGLEPVAMPRVLERVIASEQERFPLTTIELVVQPGIPIALGDNTNIEQLIRNLVGNAAKYAPPGGTVQVVTTSTQASAPNGEEIEVRVLDRGPGLAEGDAEHLFELFYRSPLTAKKAPGAGIGLFVCNHLAEAMGGRLWATNREGGGAEFGFSLRPYVADETKPDGPAATASTANAPAANAPVGVMRGSEVVRASA